jgi:prophage antirepressor-like protein
MANSQPLIVPFNFDGLNIRTFIQNDATWFVTADIASALGYEHVPHALRILDDDEKGVHKVDTLGGVQKMSICSESGMYHLVLMSKKPEAKRFRKWVTSEVLPAIRKTGQYQDDWRKSRHAAASSAKVMTSILEFVRETFGKATKPHHYMNEHKLVNSLLTGEYKGLDRETLNALELDFLAHFELREAMFIGMGMSYEQRKQRLLRESADWKVRRLGGNDDCVMIAA